MVGFARFVERLKNSIIQPMSIWTQEKSTSYDTYTDVYPESIKIKKFKLSAPGRQKLSVIIFNLLSVLNGITPFDNRRSVNEIFQKNMQIFKVLFQKTTNAFSVFNE